MLSGFFSCFSTPKKVEDCKWVEKSENLTSIQILLEVKLNQMEAKLEEKMKDKIGILSKSVEDLTKKVLKIEKNIEELYE